MGTRILLVIASTWLLGSFAPSTSSAAPAAAAKKRTATTKRKRAKRAPSLQNVRRAKAFAKKNKLPLREITVTDRNGKKQKRVFVPVLDKHQSEFFKQFGREKNTVVWKDLERDRVHARILLGEKDGFTHNSPPHHDESRYLGAAYPGRYVAMELTKPEINHMVTRFELAGNGSMWHTPNRRELVGKNFCEASGCMWWLVHAEVAPKLNLATTLGVGRSGAPENLIRKFLHQAGPKVGVIGIPVRTVEDFKNMTDEKLIGPAPKTKRGDP